MAARNKGKTHAHSESLFFRSIFVDFSLFYLFIFDYHVFPVKFLLQQLIVKEEKS